MKVTQKQAVGLLAGCGFPEKLMKKLPAKALKAKIAKLPGQEDKKPSSEVKKLYDEVVSTLSEGGKVIVVEKAGKEEKANPDKKGAKAPAKKSTSSEGNGRPGIVDYIRELLRKATAKKPLSKDDLTGACVKKFPDHTEEGLRKTVMNQTSYFIKAAGLDLQSERKDGKAVYWIKSAS
jgi:hypothetical protein